MLIRLDTLRERLHGVVLNKEEQGYDIQGLQDELDNLSDSYDGFVKFTKNLLNLKIRKDWSYVEPSSMNDILNEMDPSRPKGQITEIDYEDSSKRVEAAFIASLCGCMLGKPLEQKFTGHEIRKALEEIDEWPMSDYISKNIENVLPKVHTSFPETAREFINYVAPDDDINYTIMGMLILEKFGADFTHENMKELWIKHLPIGTTFGPESTKLLNSGMDLKIDGRDRSAFLAKGPNGPEKILPTDKPEDLIDVFNDILNPGDELCGAAIRADAYGYAYPGNPAMASELACRDASFTHNRTGVYGTMFIAATISCAQIMEDRDEIIETALKFVPQKSRFYEIVSVCFKDVKDSDSWEEAYDKISDKYGEYGHCRIYQEIGMLINTLKFAEDVGHGICIQVSQGADTDSFGATSGSILGAYFGPGYLDDKWIKPFNDDIHTGLAWFFERSVSKLAKRMSKLPTIVRR
ncbi:MAG: hypothetical protein CL756_01230 [Chloroflexi bacterium]|nr:hypothetical protein [Chloroflexota bacterium]